MVKPMGMKIFIIFAKNFGLSKPVLTTNVYLCFVHTCTSFNIISALCVIYFLNTLLSLECVLIIRA